MVSLNILDVFQNIDTLRNFSQNDQFSQMDLNVVGQDINMEIILMRCLPNFYLRFLSLQEKQQLWSFLGEIVVPFYFNIKPFKDIIDTYFKLKIEKMCSTNEKHAKLVKNSSLFSFERLPKPVQRKNASSGDLASSVVSNNDNFVRESVIIPFSQGTEAKYNDRYEKVFVVSDEKLFVEKINNGGNTENPDFALYNISIFFDYAQFEKDNGIESLTYNKENNRKSILLEVFENKAPTSNEYYYETGQLNQWLGPIHNRGLLRFSYTQNNSISEEVFLRRENASHKMFNLRTVTNMLPSFSAFKPTVASSNSFYSVESMKLEGNNVKMFLDVDWRQLAKSNSSLGSIFDFNPELINLVEIEQIEVYRDKKELYTSVQERIIDVDIQQYKIESNIKDLKRFSILDKIDNSKLYDASEQYDYKIIFSIKDNVGEFLLNKRNELLKIFNSLSLYELSFVSGNENSDGISREVITLAELEEFLQAYGNCLYNVSPLYKDEILGDIKNLYYSLNQDLRIGQNVNFFLENIKTLIDFYNQLLGYSSNAISGDEGVSYGQKSKRVEIKVRNTLSKNMTNDTNSTNTPGFLPTGFIDSEVSTQQQKDTFTLLNKLMENNIFVNLLEKEGDIQNNFVETQGRNVDKNNESEIIVGETNSVDPIITKENSVVNLIQVVSRSSSLIGEVAVPKEESRIFVGYELSETGDALLKQPIFETTTNNNEQNRIIEQPLQQIEIVSKPTILEPISTGDLLELRQPSEGLFNNSLRLTTEPTFAQEITSDTSG